ncbi:Cytochrome P450 3A4 [Tyrophagus putrescentiae]|nr:Cytochrome P450 3A4 [Tyrophagus putrescentiae]
MSWSTVLLYLSPVLFGLYFYVRHRQGYWARKGVPGPAPWFLFGNIVDLFRAGPKMEMIWLQRYGKVYGNYIGLAPVLTIAEPTLIKQVLISDFHYFINRREMRFDHEIWNKNLFLSENDAWKKIRSITSPTFTSGKLRGMNGMMSKCVQSLVRYLDKLVEKEEEGGAVMDTKEVIAGFTIDVIATTSFATETSANDDRSEKSPFVYHGMNFFRSSLFKLVFMFTMPKAVNHFFNLRLMFPADSFNYFRNLTQTIVEQRKLLIDSYVYEDELKGGGYDKLTATMEEETNTSAPSESNESAEKNNSKKTLNDLEIIAQCMIFFVAGFETTATTITNIIYELALNPEIQERLKTELESSLAGLQGPEHQDEYYETVNGKIPYLEAVIKEALRKYPPVARLDRRLGGDVPGGAYDLGGITLKKGQMIQVPTYAVHHCADFYPEPERYNPDRFMPENKHLLVPYTYLPFGSGPRNCVGMRFAYQEIKLCLAKIVPLFRFSPTPETPVPLVFNKGSLILAINSLPMKVERRV